MADAASAAAPAAGVLLATIALYVFISSKLEPATVPLPRVELRRQSFVELQGLVEPHVLGLGFSKFDFSRGKLFVADRPRNAEGKLLQPPRPGPDENGLDVEDEAELAKGKCIVLDLRDSLPAAAGDVASLIPRLKSVSFQPVSSISAVCYEDLDNIYELQRPKDYGHLISLLQSAKIYDSASHGLSYFINDKMEPWAANRIRLNEDSFGDWMALESTFARLPRVVVYPRVDGKSPDKGPSRPEPASPDSASTGTPSTARRVRQDEFRTALRQIDGEALKKCLIPTCNISFATSFNQSEAAHIIRYSILDVRKKHPLYQTILSDAGFLRGHIDDPCNGMLLCTGHHTTFDACQWTVDPATFNLVVRPDADPDQHAFKGKKLDFSHRPELHWRPSPKVWAAYNKHIYNDKGAALKAAARKSSAVTGAAAAAAVGGGGGR